MATLLPTYASFLCQDAFTYWSFPTASPPPIELLELCGSRRVPFVTIGLANQEGWWQEDDDVNRAALPAADRFEALANQCLGNAIGV